jgi:hypothetical protein
MKHRSKNNAASRFSHPSSVIVNYALTTSKLYCKLNELLAVCRASRIKLHKNSQKRVFIRVEGLIPRRSASPAKQVLGLLIPFKLHKKPDNRDFLHKYAKGEINVI